MEFNEKLQELRKSKGITQEALAQELYVSRTAVSKWESGRGYPNIESLKDISEFFSVSIDDLLSGEKLLSIAEKESNERLTQLYDFLFCIVDLFSVILVLLPLYPDSAGAAVYSVSLSAFTQASSASLFVHWALFSALFVSGLIKLLLTKLKKNRIKKSIIVVSMLLNVITVIFLALAREAYAVVVAFLLLILKAVILFQFEKK